MQPLDEDGGDDARHRLSRPDHADASGFVTVAVLLLPHIGESQGQGRRPRRPQPPGNVMVEARWPDQLDTDVDLWVQAPGDVPVGYSNKGGAVFNLLRDDLGRRGRDRLNYEVSYSRGMPAGRVHGQPAPVPQHQPSCAESR